MCQQSKMDHLEDVYPPMIDGNVIRKGSDRQIPVFGVVRDSFLTREDVSFVCFDLRRPRLAQAIVAAQQCCHDGVLLQLPLVEFTQCGEVTGEILLPHRRGQARYGEPQVFRRRSRDIAVFEANVHRSAVREGIPRFPLHAEPPDAFPQAHLRLGESMLQQRSRVAMKTDGVAQVDRDGGPVRRPASILGVPVPECEQQNSLDHGDFIRLGVHVIEVLEYSQRPW